MLACEIFFVLNPHLTYFGGTWCSSLYPGGVLWLRFSTVTSDLNSCFCWILWLFSVLPSMYTTPFLLWVTPLGVTPITFFPRALLAQDLEDLLKVWSHGGNERLHSSANNLKWNFRLFFKALWVFPRWGSSWRRTHFYFCVDLNLSYLICSLLSQLPNPHLSVHTLWSSLSSSQSTPAMARGLHPQDLTISLFLGGVLLSSSKMLHSVS